MLHFGLEHPLIINNNLYFCIYERYLKEKYHTNPGLAGPCFEQPGSGIRLRYGECDTQHCMHVCK